VKNTSIAYDLLLSTERIFFRVLKKDALEGSFGIFGLRVGFMRMTNVPDSSRDGDFYLTSVSVV